MSLRFERNLVRAAARIEAVRGADGVTRLPVLASQVPLVLRRTPEAVYLIGGTAGPIGGDRLELEIAVGAGAVLRMRTAAASVALPGLDGLESELRVSVTVRPGGRLEYLPEPLVVASGARHTSVFTVTLEAGASLVLRDEILLGRHGEAGGAVRSALRVDYAGRPLLRQSLEVSGGDSVSLGPAVLSGHRAVGNLLLVNAPCGAGPETWVSEVAGSVRGPGAPGEMSGAQVTDGSSVAPDGPGVAVMPLAGPGVLVTALADDAVTLRRRLGSQ
jgi:urease accessory protein